MNSNNNTHIKYLDSLRVLASIMVIGIHTSGIDFSTNNISRAFDYACGFAVPLFITISGASFIGNNIGIKKLYKKILQLIIAYIL